MKRALCLLLVLAACKSEEAKKVDIKESIADVVKQEEREKILAGVGLPAELFQGSINLIEETTVDEIVYTNHTRRDTMRVNYIFKDSRLHQVAINKRKPDTIMINYSSGGKISTIIKTDGWKPYLTAELAYDANGRCTSFMGRFYSVGIGMSFKYNNAGDTISTFNESTSKKGITSFKVLGDTILVEEKIETPRGYVLNAVKKYNATGRKIGDVSYLYEDAADTIGYREIARYDKYGSLIEKTTESRGPGNNVLEYVYDEKGNWTERRMMPKNKNEGWLSVTTRKITYR